MMSIILIWHGSNRKVRFYFEKSYTQNIHWFRINISEIQQSAQDFAETQNGFMSVNEEGDCLNQHDRDI